MKPNFRGKSLIFKSALTCLSFVAALLVSVGLIASDAFTQPQAKASFPDTSFDFGTVLEGQKVTHEFAVKNEGAANLIIQRLVPACGCTAASSTNEPIPPGEEAKIKIDFDTTGFSGEKLKTVRVFTNDPDHSSVLLTVKGVVENDVSVEPRSVFLQDVIRGVPGPGNKKEVAVKVREGSDAQITSVKSFSRFLSIEELEGGPRRRRFEVSVSPEAPVGELRDRVVIGISGAKESSINLPVFAAVRGKIIVKPEQLAFGVLEGDKVLMRSVKIENLGSEPIAIREVQSNHPAIVASYKEIEAGKSFVIQVRVDPTKVEKSLRSAVTVSAIERATGIEPEGKISFNVFGLLPPKESKG